MDKLRGLKGYWIGVAFLLLAFAVSVTVIIVGSKSCLNADMSSELILAKMLAKENSILTQNWFYSTEIRIFSVAQVAAVFFHFFSDFQLVRILTAITMLFLPLGSFHFLLRGFRVSKTVRVWCEAAAFVRTYKSAYMQFV